MNDLSDLLERAAGPVVADDATVDADVARGRRALRRRRATRLGAGAAAVALTGAVAVAGTGAWGDDPDPAPVDAATAPLDVDGVRLVVHRGEQPSGYEVGLVPDGWEIQGAAPQHLTIAPIDMSDQEPASFEGKLVVMLRSASAQGTPVGTPVPVGGDSVPVVEDDIVIGEPVEVRTGYLDDQGETLILTYEDDLGSWLQVQVPVALGWSEDEITAFAAGVTLTADAEPGLG